MVDEEMEDAPPDLVVADNTPITSLNGVEGQVEDLNLVKVPISIVTGE